MDRIPLRDAPNLQNRVIPICWPFNAPHPLHIFATLPTHSFPGWVDITIYPPTPPRVGVCGITGWCAGVEGRAVPRHTTGAAWHCSATLPEPVIQQCYVFSQDDGGERKKNPHMMAAKSWFVTPSSPWSAPFFHLMCTIDIKVPASRFPNQKTIFFKKTCFRNTAFCPPPSPSMAKPPLGKRAGELRGNLWFLGWIASSWPARNLIACMKSSDARNAAHDGPFWPPSVQLNNSATKYHSPVGLRVPGGFRTIHLGTFLHVRSLEEKKEGSDAAS